MIKKLNKYLLINISIFLMIFICNCLTPMMADDYSYSFSMATGERIVGIIDILQSQIAHYFDWGGRSVVHFLAQLFLWLGKPAFNFFNSLIFVIYINLITMLAFGKNGGGGIVLSFLVVWFFMPSISSVIFWLTGSCNYLWGATIILGYIYRYYKGLKCDKEDGWALSILWLAYSVLAGWCNENTSGMGILISILFTFCCYKKRKKFFRWQVMGILGCSIGFAFMILAPGNYVRADLFDTYNNKLFMLYDRFESSNARAFAAAGEYQIIYFIFLLSFFILLFLPVEKEKKVISAIWCIGGNLCNFAMILSPIYPARASFGVYTMYFISIFYAIRVIMGKLKQENLMKFIRAFLCVWCLYFFISYIEASCDLINLYVKNRNRVEQVLSEIENGNLDVTVSAIEPKTKYNVLFSINDWPDYEVKEYFGLNSITIK